MTDVSSGSGGLFPHIKHLSAVLGLFFPGVHCTAEDVVLIGEAGNVSGCLK